MIGNFVEAIVFGLFTIIMLFDQLSAIFENLPGIDALQNKVVSNRKSKYQSLIDVFGSKFNYYWFIPGKPTQQLINMFNQDINEVEYLPMKPKQQKQSFNNGTHSYELFKQRKVFDTYSTTQPLKQFINDSNNNSSDDIYNSNNNKYK